MSLTPADVAAIERATLDAVPPESLEVHGAWLLGLDPGTVGRAHSAVPLSHDAADVDDPSSVERIEARYAREGLRPVFRLPVLPAFDGVAQALARRGYASRKPTCTFTGTVKAMAALAPRADVEVLRQPDDGWRAVFLGDGFDPADGASRVEILARARHAVFACVRVNGVTVAAGMGSYSQGWASIHGMRTLASHRGKGMAGRILVALAREAEARGISRAFLQVEAGNPAQALYRRAGFEWAWDYTYWS
ncbi:MAG: GNAT family N-acetyltransferase [Comamonadaceae bacterium]|nr:MAG: GNAT family N-acetyltransferase [Comamonadaceae bacterium]